jgi:hypothetical protein
MLENAIVGLFGVRNWHNSIERYWMNQNAYLLLIQFPLEGSGRIKDG